MGSFGYGEAAGPLPDALSFEERLRDKRAGESSMEGSHGYSSGFTVRTGRTVRLGEGRSACTSVILLLLLASFIVVVPCSLLAAEREFRDRVLAFNEAGAAGVIECKSSASDNVGTSLSTLEECAAHGAGGPVHIASDQVAGSVRDPAFGVELDKALQLDRHTEYCQWDEHVTDTCQKCTDNNGKSHDCNCYRTHSYVKGWRSHRINSLLFDQPSAHHNPQRDPYPSSSMFSSDARIGDVALRVEVLNNKHATLRGPSSRRVNWTPTAAREPRFYDSFWNWLEGNVLPESVARWFSDTTRYEQLGKLANAHTAEAARQHNFVYVGQSKGFFFSPYMSDTREKLLKMFFQHLEGSLFDWQLGDLMPSCTAGDIRVSYRTKDPQQLSVVGKLVDGRSGHELTLHTTSRGYELGMAHAGVVEWEEMFEFEAADAKVRGRNGAARRKQEHGWRMHG